MRFSTVVGSRGSADTVRDVRGFATKFYTDEGNFDLVGNNIPVFFIQDGIKFPDLIHAVKPEHDREIPQASSAHDTFWDFASLTPRDDAHAPLDPLGSRHPADFDLLDASKLIPEELVPVQRIGKLTLTRNTDDFFAETEQVAYHTANVVPGIDFTDDPLLAVRNFSYLDTQLLRLGGPNFTEIPINRPLAPVHNMNQDGFMQQRIKVGRVNYTPSSPGGGCPALASMQQGAYMHHPEARQIAAGRARGRRSARPRHRSRPRQPPFNQALMASIAQHRHRGIDRRATTLLRGSATRSAPRRSAPAGYDRRCRPRQTRILAAARWSGGRETGDWPRRASTRLDRSGRGPRHDGRTDPAKRTDLEAWRRSLADRERWQIRGAMAAGSSDQ